MSKGERSQSTGRRIFRMKKAALDFFCPLCREERQISVSPRLSLVHYVQAAVGTLFVSMLLYPFMEWRGLFSFFFLIAGVEWFRRSLFKKEVPCPYCGFDATDYKKDVIRARQKVEEFWQEREISKNEVSANAETSAP